MTRRVNLYRWDQLPLEKITEMVTRKVIASDDLSLIQAYFKKGALVPLHTHRSDFFVYVLQGALRVQIGAEDMTVREGEVLTIPGGTAHQAESLDDSFVMTIGLRA